MKMEIADWKTGIKALKLANAAMSLTIAGALGFLLLASLNCESPLPSVYTLGAEDSLVVVAILKANNLTWAQASTSAGPNSAGRIVSLAFHSKSIDTIPADIGKLINLQYLDLIGCNLRALPHEVEELTDLKDLDLSRNRLVSLPDGLRSLKLTHVGLSNNSLTSLPINIDVTQLRSLDLDSNLITALPPDFKYLAKLEELRINHNLLDSLPADLSSLDSLRRLSVADNRLKALPPSIMQMRFDFLDVGRNQLCFPQASLADSADAKIVAWLDATDRDWRQSQACP